MVQSATVLPSQSQDRVTFDADPARYRHWNLSFDGPVAKLALDVDEDGGLRPGYKLKLNTYHLGVDIEQEIDGLRLPGCKHLVGTRLKRAGMHWDKQQAQAILQLRLARLNDRWDCLWN